MYSIRRQRSKFEKQWHYIFGQLKCPAISGQQEKSYRKILNPGGAITNKNTALKILYKRCIYLAQAQRNFIFSQVKNLTRITISAIKKVEKDKEESYGGNKIQLTNSWGNGNLNGGGETNVAEEESYRAREETKATRNSVS